jgi:hypothetical protein
MKQLSESQLDHIYTDELVFQKDVLDWLQPRKREGIKVLRICDRYAKGYSDLFICVNGVFVVAELKDDTGKPTPHQLLFIREMVACGAIGGVCRTLRDVSDLIDEAKDRANGQTS